jgi:hypothetical protein
LSSADGRQNRYVEEERTMSKIFAVAVAGLLTFGMVGCGGSSAPAKPAEPVKPADAIKAAGDEVKKAGEEVKKGAEEVKTEVTK